MRKFGSFLAGYRFVDILIKISKVVRIDLLVPRDGRDLNSNELRDEVNDVYSQLLELCKPLA